MPAPTQVQNFVNGKYVDVITTTATTTIPVTTPHTGELIANVPMSGRAEADAAVESAQSAFTTVWSKKTTKSRVQIMLRFHSLVMEKYSNELADLIVREHGKTKPEALAEIAKGLETWEYACSLPQLAQGRQLDVSRGVQCRDERCPLGVVVSIVPFNFPFMVPFWTIGHALALGNTMVLKPSEKVPLTMTRVAGILQEAGLPDGVFNIVHGSVEAVNALCDHAHVKAVTFVGTSKVAELLSKRCRNLNKRVLALGGAKNHLVAAPDCNVNMTAQDVLNSFAGCSGQRCMAASVLLTIGHRQDLLDNLIQRARQVTAGSGSNQIGPVIDRASFDRIRCYIAEAETKHGATILLDGRGWANEKPSGFWIGPTILLCRTHTEPAMTEEIFGPVLSVYVCKDAEEAIRIENGNPYGNAACIYTENGKVAEWFTERFSAGMLGVNIGVPVPREPFSFGGINASKYGDVDITGDGGMEFFTWRKKITSKWSVPEKQTWLN